MSDKYDALIRRLLVACNLDSEILPGLHEDAIVLLIQHKVGEFDKRIEAAQRAVDRWREAAEIEHGDAAKAEAERDAIVQLMVYDTHVMDDGNSPVPVFGIHCHRHATFSARDQAVAAVRKAAGLEAS